MIGDREEMPDDMPLSDVLAAIGWSHESCGLRGRAVRCDQGHSLGGMTADQTWFELAARGLVTWLSSPRPEWMPRVLCACVEVAR